MKRNSLLLRLAFVFSITTTALSVSATSLSAMAPLPVQNHVRFLTYSIGVSSNIFTINGCQYRYSVTVTFDWDGISGHAPTNVSTSNGVLTQDCGPRNFIYYARISDNTSLTSPGGSYTFDATRSTDADYALATAAFNADIKNAVNAAINSVVKP